jgi:hypothetical protein
MSFKKIVELSNIISYYLFFAFLYFVGLTIISCIPGYFEFEMFNNPIINKATEAFITISFICMAGTLISLLGILILNITFKVSGIAYKNNNDNEIIAELKQKKWKGLQVFVSIIVITFSIGCSIWYIEVSKEEKDLRGLIGLLPEIALLEKSNTITGSWGGSGSGNGYMNNWGLYRTMYRKYTPEVLYEEYFKTSSTIVKVYLYLILWEREYSALEVVEKDIKQYYNQKVYHYMGGSCGTFDGERNVEDIISSLMYDINEIKLSTYERENGLGFNL